MRIFSRLIEQFKTTIKISQNILHKFFTPNRLRNVTTKMRNNDFDLYSFIFVLGFEKE